jgi:hypothetical protein
MCDNCCCGDCCLFWRCCGDNFESFHTNISFCILERYIEVTGLRHSNLLGEFSRSITDTKFCIDPLGTEDNATWSLNLYLNSFISGFCYRSLNPERLVESLGDGGSDCDVLLTVN